MYHKPIPIKHIIILCLILLTYTSFYPVLNSGFIELDDDVYVTKNPYIQKGLTWKGFLWAFRLDNKAGLWLPLTWLSLMIDYQFYGLNSGGYHLTNLLIHIFNVMLLFLVFESITGALWQSAFLAALFAIHPLRVESVAWITERKDVLSGLFFILTIWAYARYVDKKSIKRYFAVFLLFFLGLMAKPMLVTLPFVLLLMDYWPLERYGSGKFSNSKHSPHGSNLAFILSLIIEKIPLFILSALVSMITVIIQKSKGALIALESIPIGTRIANAFISYVKYIWKMLLPQNLAVLYPYPTSFPFLHIAGAVLFLFSVTIFVILKTNKPYLFTGWFFYLGTLFPIIGFLQVGLQAMADRFTYIPLIGLFIIFAWWVPEVFLRLPYRKSIFSILSALILSILMTTTWLQVRYWKDTATLFEHCLRVTKNNWLIHNNLGSFLLANNKTKESIFHLKESLKIKPNFAYAHYNLGIALTDTGKTQEGIFHFKEALSISPRFANAHYNLGNALVGIGKISKGIFHYKEAIKINPNYKEAYNNLGFALLKEGGINDAMSNYFKTLSIDPNSVPAHFNLAIAFEKKGDFREAINHYRKALQIKPDHKEAHFQLGKAYLKIRDTDSAKKEYKHLIDMDPNLANLLYKKIYDTDPPNEHKGK